MHVEATCHLNWPNAMNSSFFLILPFLLKQTLPWGESPRNPMISLGNEPNISQTFSSGSGIQPVDVKNLFSIDSKIPKKFWDLAISNRSNRPTWSHRFLEHGYLPKKKIMTPPENPLKGWKSQFFFGGHWKQSLWKKNPSVLPKDICSKWFNCWSIWATVAPTLGRIVEPVLVISLNAGALLVVLGRINRALWVMCVCFFSLEENVLQPPESRAFLPLDFLLKFLSIQ